MITEKVNILLIFMNKYKFTKYEELLFEKCLKQKIKISPNK